jgi:hypothetical protein
MLPPLLVFMAMRLIPDEAYCAISMEESSSLIYFFLIIFCLPLSIIFVFYIYLIYKMRLSSLSCSSRQRNQRDYIVIQCIMLIVAIIGITSLPAITYLIIYVSHGHFDSSIVCNRCLHL